jgi:hypothetical protein
MLFRCIKAGLLAGTNVEVVLLSVVGRTITLDLQSSIQLFSSIDHPKFFHHDSKGTSTASKTL